MRKTLKNDKISISTQALSCLKAHLPREQRNRQALKKILTQAGWDLNKVYLCLFNLREGEKFEEAQRIIDVWARNRLDE